MTEKFVVLGTVNSGTIGLGAFDSYEEAFEYLSNLPDEYNYYRIEKRFVK